MKKAIFISGFLALAFPFLASASIDQNLKYGMQGQQVSELQDLLSSEGCLSVPSTGFFGLLTLKGVECFQTKYNIESTGYFGSLSRAQANKIIADATTESDQAEVVETGTTAPLTSCAAGDLFDIFTGAPCTSKSIQQTITSAVNQAVQQAVTNIGQTQVGTNPVGGITPPSVTVGISPQSCVKKLINQQTSSQEEVIGSQFTVKTTGDYDGGTLYFTPVNESESTYGLAFYPPYPYVFGGVAPGNYNLSINLYDRINFPPALRGHGDGTPVATLSEPITVTDCASSTDTMASTTNQ